MFFLFNAVLHVYLFNAVLHVYLFNAVLHALHTKRFEANSNGRVLDSRPKGSGFEPHRRHCVVVLEQDTFILA